eukprot:scaffold31037_cov16-Tisochrysis_lutea.AAC.1
MLRGGFPGGLGLPPGHTMMLTMPVDVALAGLGGSVYLAALTCYPNANQKDQRDQRSAQHDLHRSKGWLACMPHTTHMLTALLRLYPNRFWLTFARCQLPSQHLGTVCSAHSLR